MELKIVLDLLANGVVVLAGNKLLIVQVVWHGYKDYQWVKRANGPPFPMSDYGTGCLGAIAIMLGIYKRHKYGGSYLCTSSLVQYDLLLLKQGQYPEELWKSQILLNDKYKEFTNIRYYDSVDKISKTALDAMIAQRPGLLNNAQYFVKQESKGFGATISTLKPVCQFDTIETGYRCSSRPNGYDAPEWW